MASQVPQLKDASLFVGKNYINNKWVDSVSSKTFNVYGKSRICPEWANRPEIIDLEADMFQTQQQAP